MSPDPAALTILARQAKHLAHIWQRGVVEEVDYRRSRLRVRLGDPLAMAGSTLSHWMQWLPARAFSGSSTTWDPPVIGESVLLACPGGDLANAIVVGSLPSVRGRPPLDEEAEHRATLTRRRWGDGTTITYDQIMGKMVAEFRDGSTVSYTCEGLPPEESRRDQAEPVEEGVLEANVNGRVEIKARSSILLNARHITLRATDQIRVQAENDVAVVTRTGTMYLLAEKNIIEGRSSSNTGQSQDRVLP